MAVVTRPPRADEAATLTALHSRAWRETYTGKFPEYAWGEEATARRQQMWTRFCTDPEPDWITRVAELDGEPIGVAHSSLDEDGRRYLWLIYVLAGYHGHGAGSALLAEVLGEGPASVFVLESNLSGQKFYERMGFRLDGARMTSEFPEAGDEVRMVR